MFWIFKNVLYSTLLHLPPSDITVPEDAGETKFSLQFQFSLPKRKRGRTLLWGKEVLLGLADQETSVFISRCRNAGKKVIMASAFLRLVNCVSLASAFRNQGQSGTTGLGLHVVRHCPNVQLYLFQHTLRSILVYIGSLAETPQLPPPPAFGLINECAIGQPR
jgi:hypothetical protein